MAHHVDECLSELTFYMYEARRAPLAALKQVVRQNFVANQYPRSMERLYRWTPDEAIPAFYNDPAIFRSRHKDLGLEDIELPGWFLYEDETRTERWRKRKRRNVGVMSQEATSRCASRERLRPAKTGVPATPPFNTTGRCFATERRKKKREDAEAEAKKKRNLFRAHGGDAATAFVAYHRRLLESPRVSSMLHA